jgi:hypothetical protein
MKVISPSKRKWIGIFHDTIYKYYCSGHNKVYKWELQKELKFLQSMFVYKVYTDYDAERLNSIKDLYEYIKNGEV